MFIWLYQHNIIIKCEAFEHSQLWTCMYLVCDGSSLISVSSLSYRQIACFFPVLSQHVPPPSFLRSPWRSSSCCGMISGYSNYPCFMHSADMFVTLCSSLVYPCVILSILHVHIISLFLILSLNVTPTNCFNIYIFVRLEGH